MYEAMHEITADDALAVSVQGHGGKKRAAAALSLADLILRRHKLPAPHLALWPTEVHVVVRRKVCEKGCYFGGIYPPPVAIGKMKVCM